VEMQGNSRFENAEQKAGGTRWQGVTSVASLGVVDIILSKGIAGSAVVRNIHVRPVASGGVVKERQSERHTRPFCLLCSSSHYLHG
jgi:hypothetical protein